MVNQGIQNFTFSKNAFDLGNSHLMINNDIPRAVFALNGSLGEDVDVGCRLRVRHRSVCADDRERDGWPQSGVRARCDRRTERTARLPCHAGRRFVQCGRRGLRADQLSLAMAWLPPMPSPTFSRPRGPIRAAAATGHDGQHQEHAVLQLGGPVAVAFGVEYRKESQVVTSSDLSASNAFLFAGNSTPYRGEFDVTEGYVDTLVPLLHGQAVREGADVQRRVPLRGLQQHRQSERLEGRPGLRAGSWLPFARHPFDRHPRPAICELYSGGNGADQHGDGAWRHREHSAERDAGKSATSRRKTQRRPRTESSGSRAPARSASLSASIDYYDIKIDNAITTLSAATVAGLCNLGNQQFCDYFTFNAAGQATSLNATTLNLASFADARASTSTLLTRTSLPDVFRLPTKSSTGLLGTPDAAPPTSTRGVAGPSTALASNGPQNLGAVPRMTLNLTQTIGLGDASFSAQGLYVSRGTVDSTYNTIPTLTINDNSIGSVVLLNLYGSYDMNDHVQFSASLRNALDRAPPVSPYRRPAAAAVQWAVLRCERSVVPGRW